MRGQNQLSNNSNFVSSNNSLSKGLNVLTRGKRHNSYFEEFENSKLVSELKNFLEENNNKKDL